MQFAEAPLSAIEGVERLIVTRDKLGWHRKVAITTRLQKLREKVDNFEQEVRTCGPRRVAEKDIPKPLLLPKLDPEHCQAIARSQAVTTAKEALEPNHC